MGAKRTKSLERWKREILERKCNLEKELASITGENTPSDKTPEWLATVKRLKRRLKRQKSRLKECEHLLSLYPESSSEYSFISKNNSVVEFVEEMAAWIEFATLLSNKEVKQLFLQDKTRVLAIFAPYPETILSSDPSYWAEILAVNWGVLAERPLEFVG